MSENISRCEYRYGAPPTDQRCRIRNGGFCLESCLYPKHKGILKVLVEGNEENKYPLDEVVDILEAVLAIPDLPGGAIAIIKATLQGYAKENLAEGTATIDFRKYYAIKPTPCPTCGGRGKQPVKWYPERDPFGHPFGPISPIIPRPIEWDDDKPCPDCHGTGKDGE